MSIIRVTASIMGVSTPATLAEDAGGTYYKFQRDPDWTPNDPRYHPDPPEAPHPQNARSSARRAARLAEYTRLRDGGKLKAQAAAEMRLGKSTASMYEREYEQRRQGGAS